MSKEKSIKIKKSNKNIYYYLLEIEDLWGKDFYKKSDFYQVLKNLKNLDIKVNEVVQFYNRCFNNTYEHYFDDVNDELNKRKEEELQKEKEKDKEDVHNFNPNDNGVEESSSNSSGIRNENNDDTKKGKY